MRLLTALRHLGQGDCSVRLPVGRTHLSAAVAQAFNEVAEVFSSTTAELDRLKRELHNKDQEIEQARRAAGDRAEPSSLTSRYGSDFLANLSHELRAPLNSLLILAELLSDDPGNDLTPRHKEFARTIFASGSDLLARINDILDMARIESGAAAVDATEVLFSDLRDSMERAFSNLADSKGLHFAFLLADDLPRAICTDAKRLYQLLRHVLAHALAITQDGEVVLCVEVARGGWSPNHPMLSRTDTVLAFTISIPGVSIPTHKLEDIVEPCRRANGTVARTRGGTDLGLALCREILRLLGGEACLQIAPDESWTITLYLPQTCPSAKGARAAAWVVGEEGSLPATNRQPPLELVSAELDTVVDVIVPKLAPRREKDSTTAANELPVAGLPGKLPEEGAGLAGRKVLIVDDDIRTLFALTSMLERWEIEVLRAENGRQALEILGQAPDIELVLMDLLMPQMDGFEAIRTIRRRPHLLSLPIIALTAKVTGDDREKSREAGASAYLAKPVASGQLLTLLRAWLARGEEVAV
jgi:signal transduction histidine kinase/ActR/RegA family two-component response regulator